MAKSRKPPEEPAPSQPATAGKKMTMAQRFIEQRNIRPASKALDKPK